MGRWKTELYYGKTFRSNYRLDTFDIKTKTIAKIIIYMPYKCISVNIKKHISWLICVPFLMNVDKMLNKEGFIVNKISILFSLHEFPNATIFVTLCNLLIMYSEEVKMCCTQRDHRTYLLPVIIC